jgi:anti-sigma regulatory factor (Ser/Thr protein kinase)
VSPARHFPAVPESAGAARTFVRTFLHDCPDDLVDSAVLLTSELVTNAIVHAKTAFELELTSPDARVHIAVTDDSRDLPSVESHEALDEHGRGIPLVASQADDWGIEATRFGKTVWFSLTLPE